MAFKDKSQAVKYQNEFNKAKYDRVTVMLDKGGKDKLKAIADSLGISVNEYIKQAIAARMDRDGITLDKLQDDHNAPGV